MNKPWKFLVCALILLNCFNILADSRYSNICSIDCADSCGPKSIFIPRSQGANTARELVGWQPLIHLDICDWYLTAAFAFEYQRSFNSRKIADALFGTNQLVFVGSENPCRNEEPRPLICSSECKPLCCQIIADNFGFSQHSSTVLNLSPRIDNFIFDFEFFWGLNDNDCLDGLYFRLNMPVVHTRWNLFDNDCCSTSICRTNCNPCTPINPVDDLDATPFPPCYMATGTVAPFTTICDGLSGKTFGDMQLPWLFGKFPFCKRTKTGVADLDLIVGYDFFRCPDWHFGLYLQAVAPTGNKPSSEFIFSPIVGNGHHWEFGAGISTHWDFWEDDCGQSWSFWFEGNLTHMFNSCQERSFDLKINCLLSRYLLLKEINSDNNYAGSLINAIDFTTRQVKVSRDVKGDFTLKFCYENCGFLLDLGYNIYGHSREKADCDCGLPFTRCNVFLKGKQFGIKGEEGVCCDQFNFTIAGGVRTLVSDLGPVPLNSTVSSANICEPTIAAEIDNKTTTEVFTGFGASAGTTCLTYNSVKTIGATYTLNNGSVNTSGVIVAQTSNPPVLLTDADIDVSSGLTCAQLTHKFFAQLTYFFDDTCDCEEECDCGCGYEPFLGVGTSVEFAQNNCNFTGLNQWGVLLKCGLLF